MMWVWGFSVGCMAVGTDCNGGGSPPGKVSRLLHLRADGQWHVQRSESHDSLCGAGQGKLRCLLGAALWQPWHL